MAVTEGVGHLCEDEPQCQVEGPNSVRALLDLLSERPFLLGAEALMAMNTGGAQ
jgi:hypothetical protein